MLTDSDLQSVTTQAEVGSAGAQFRLAVHYLTDTATGPRLHSAREWAEKAAHSNYPEAKALLAELGSWDTHIVSRAETSIELFAGLMILTGLAAIFLITWALAPKASLPNIEPTHGQSSPPQSRPNVAFAGTWRGTYSANGNATTFDLIAKQKGDNFSGFVRELDSRNQNVFSDVSGEINGSDIRF